LTLVLALIAAAPALAGEPPFPAEGDRWLLSVQAPAAGPWARYARIFAEPDQRGGWAVAVVCGRRNIVSGAETLTLRAEGVAARARGGWLGGTYRPSPGPSGTGGFTVLEQAGLDAQVAMPAPCPTGVGQFSSGD
jgi:hypothetical protein